MKNSGTVLMYNCSGPEYAKLRQIFAMLRLRMRTVTPDRYHLSLDELAMGQGEPSTEAVEAIPERMLVFCHMVPVFTNQVLDVIRLAKLPPIELKAILTASNRTWNTMELRKELLREHEAIVNSLKGGQPGSGESEESAQETGEENAQKAPEQPAQAEQEPDGEEK